MQTQQHRLQKNMYVSRNARRGTAAFRALRLSIPLSTMIEINTVPRIAYFRPRPKKKKLLTESLQSKNDFIYVV